MAVPKPESETPMAPAFEHTTVAEAMHAGVLTCPVDAPLRTVARMMETYRVHCVVVFDQRVGAAEEGTLWGVVSDLDLVAGLISGDADVRTAGETAATPVIMVSPAERLPRAAQLMTEHGTSHLVVVDPETGLPVGILSTLDLAAAAARGATA